MLVHASESARDAEAEYSLAKSGDAMAALALASALMEPSKVDWLSDLAFQHNGVFIAVSADERSGFNAIPDAMALYLDLATDVPVSHGDVVQINKVSHTKAKSLQRIVTPAQFAGGVKRGARYILVDDHTGLGGTLANLRGFLMAGGATVIWTTTLTASPGSDQLAILKGTHDLLLEQFGNDLDEFWQERFGHGIDCLTEREGRAILQTRAQSVAGLADRLAEAAEEVRGRGL
ncbi:MAG: phosphoribosyltransferase [Hyphomonadaceae bacterium]|nr:phosphoribosyltransferase [Hyphomonadaceae bacterium]